MARYHKHIGVVILLILILLRPYLEATPSRHMLILFPGLAIGGAFLIHGFIGKKADMGEAAANGITLISVSMVLFWMLPRYLDQSLVNPFVEALKFTTIPIVIGGFLALSWRKTNPYLRGFLQANALSMLGVLAFLYTHAPVRICNSYLVTDQYALGIHFLWVTLVLTLYWSVPLFLTSKDFTSAQKTDGLSRTNKSHQILIS